MAFPLATTYACSALLPFGSGALRCPWSGARGSAIGGCGWWYGPMAYVASPLNDLDDAWVDISRSSILAAGERSRAALCPPGQRAASEADAARYCRRPVSRADMSAFAWTIPAGTHRRSAAPTEEEMRGDGEAVPAPTKRRCFAERGIIQPAVRHLSWRPNRPKLSVGVWSNILGRSIGDIGDPKAIAQTIVDNRAPVG